MIFDLPTLVFIREYIQNPIFNILMPLFSFIGEYGMIWILIGGALICGKKSRPYGIMLLIAISVSYVLGEVMLKNIVCRVRPCNVFTDVSMIVKRPDSFSFPSGHSSSSFCASTILLLYDKRIGIPALGLAGCIAFSRLYLFVHYPTDVLAGILLGISCALLTYVVYKKFFWKDKNSLV
ncbi:MAG TPA: phosphatase PAP2 family protein [Clostridiales bacterium]|nr:phosphatase PAP2 family protein [Clostridiales bacterium]